MVKPLFSIVLISRNESKRIELFLEPLKPFLACGGDLVVVDSNSSDNTCDIITTYGGTVVSVGEKYRKVGTKSQIKKFNRFLGTACFESLVEKKLFDPKDIIFDFAGSRNEGADAAQTHYILQLDCGDIIQALNVEAINAMLVEGVNIKMTHYLSDTNKHQVNRFYDRRYFQYYNRCHEYTDIKPGVDRTKLTILLAPEHILCPRYYRQAGKPRPYIFPLYLDLMDNTSYYRCWYYFSRELFYSEQWDTCVIMFEKALVTATSAWPTEQSSGLIFMGKCWIRLNNLDKASECFSRSLQYDASRREAWIELAWVAVVRQQHILAKTYAYAALTLPFSPTLYEPYDNYQEVPHVIIMISAHNLSKSKTQDCVFMQEAVEHWQKANDYNPNHNKVIEFNSQFNLEKK